MTRSSLLIATILVLAGLSPGALGQEGSEDEPILLGGLDEPASAVPS